MEVYIIETPYSPESPQWYPYPYPHKRDISAPYYTRRADAEREAERLRVDYPGQEFRVTTYISEEDVLARYRKC